MNKHCHAIKGIISLVAYGVIHTTSMAAEQATQIEEITVTGQKIERSLQDTPTSIGVTTAADMEEYNLNDLSDVFNRTANIVSTFGGSGYTIRGITNTNITGSGLGDLATVYIDGAPVPRDMIQAGTLDIWDASQVEILRGPQSTLQGRNSLAGAVFINTVNPEYEWTARGLLQTFDETGERRVAAAFGGPIAGEQVAFRIAGEWAEEDGQIFNPTRDEYASQAEVSLLRAKLLIEPTAAPDLKILLSHMHNTRDFGRDFSFMDEPLSSWEDRRVYDNDPFLDDTVLDLTIANISYQLSDALNLAAITTYNHSDRFRSRDGDFTAENLSRNGLESSTATLTGELRLTMNTDNVSGVMGLYYSDLDAADSSGFSTFFIFPAALGLEGLLQGPPFGLDAGTAAFASGLYADGVLITSRFNNPTEIETRAIFADFTWQVTDRFRLFAGFRYDQEMQTLNNRQVTEIISTLPNPADFGPLLPVIAGVNAFIEAEIADANDPGQEEDTDFNAFLPKLGVSYDINDNANLSFVVQRGYRSGGAGTNSARATVHTFDQEFTWNYELSLRSQWLENRLTLNANLFYIDWTDQQVLVYLSENIFDSETQNASSSEVYGYEIELDYVVNDQFKLFASLGNANTKINAFDVLVNGEIIDRSGNKFANAPEYTIAVGGTWENEIGLFASFDVNHITERFSEIDMDQSTGEDIPARTLVNVKVGYRQEQYGIYLIATNLFDEEYFHNSFIDSLTDSRVGRFGEGRVIGLGLEASF